MSEDPAGSELRVDGADDSGATPGAANGRPARLFVAVWPPADVVDALAALERPAARGVRWTTPEQWHVTVRFLGTVDVEAATAALARVDAARTEAVIGPKVRRLGVGVAQVPVAGLDELALAVASAFDGVGQAPTHERFHGHLTLARLKGTRSCPMLGTELTATFPVTEVTLVASDTHQSGARYSVVATQPLRPATSCDAPTSCDD